jgi:hypothetical protein
MNTDDRFDQLKQKFQPALRALEQQGASIQMMNIQDNRLVVRAAVSTPAERDRIFAAFRQVDPSLQEVHVDIRSKAEGHMPATGQTTVQTSQEFSQQGEPPPGEAQ